MWLKLKQWYSLDMYEQEGNRRVARILLGLIFIYGFLSLCILLMGLKWGGGRLTSSLILGFFLQIIPLYFLLRGNLSAAGFAMVGLYIALITIFATLGQGIRDYVIMAYPVVIVFAGLAEKQRGLILSALLTSSALAWLVLGEKAGWFVIRPIFAPTWFDLILAILIVVFIALEVNMMVVNLKDRLAQLNHELGERRQIEAVLKESEERYRAVVSNAPLVILVTDEKGTFTLSEGKGLAKLGLQPGEGVGMSLFDVYRDYPSILDASKNALAGQSQRIEVEVQGIVFDAIFSPTFDQHGRVVKVVVVSNDVTERKQVEKALHESEARNRAMMEANPDMMFVQNRAGVYIDYHAANSQLLVAPPEVFLGRATRDVIPPAQLDALQFKFDLAFQTGEIQTHEYVFDLADGAHHFETRMNAYDHDRLLSIVRDITERKQAERKFLDMEKLQRILLNSTRLTTIALLDPRGVILLMNEYGAQLIGKSPDEIIGLSLYDVFPREVADLRKAKLGQVCYTAAAVHFEDSRQGISFETSMYPILDTNGKVAQIAVYARDITKRKQNERLLRESEQRYRALAEAAHDMIFVIDRDDRIVYVNSYSSMQLGASPETVIGQPRSRWFETDDADKTRKNLEKVFETSSPHYGETEIVFPRGTVHLSTWLVPLKDQNGVVDTVLGVSRDISELKKLENSLKTTNQQLEAKVEERTAELRVSHKDLRKLTHEIVAAQEEERRRISRELHDEAGQSLIGLRFSLDAVYRELPARLGGLRQRMEKALALTDEAVKRLRMLAYNLRPPMLDLMGINLVIKELCREFSEQTGIEVEYSGVELEDLQDEVSISLYRFVQETLTNAAKHARASRIQVTLECQNEMIKASVQDNGRGISAEAGNKGLGLVGIKERFSILGGWLEVKPVIPSGSLVQVCLPRKNIVEP